MFTGLVETLGHVTHFAPEGAGARLALAVPLFVDGVHLGDSIAVNGTCLTVIDIAGDVLSFQLAPETLRKTNLGRLHPGDGVNLERSLRVGDRLGGHWVQGHVDGQGRLRERRPDGDWEMFWFDCPRELTRLMVPKGSLAIDGISLTLVNVTEDSFSVALIPHTLSVTTLGKLKPGAPVNLETDILAKHVEKLLAGFLPRSEGYSGGCM
jgi:riboflavin synthase